MLGEAARTMPDADRYFEAYADAIRAIGGRANGGGPITGAGISVKLSALHPRYEFSQRDRALGELALRLKDRSEEHTSALQSLMRITYDVFCLKQKNSMK